MSAEIAIVLGLGIICVLMVVYAVILRQNKDRTNQTLSMFFAFLSLVFLNVLLFSVYQMAQENNGELINVAPCDNLLMNTTFNPVTNLTTYAYADSCAGRSVPSGGSLNYLSDYILVYAVQFIIYLTLVLAVLYFFALLLHSIREGMGWVKTAGTSKAKKREDEDER